MKTIIKKVLGVILIIYGVFAFFSPFTPGSWLALIGLELLGIRRYIFRKFLTDGQRAAVVKYMKKMKRAFSRQPKVTTDKKGDNQQPPA